MNILKEKSDIQELIELSTKISKGGYKYRYRDIITDDGYLYPKSSDDEILIGTESYFSWLSTNKSFRYESYYGNLYCFKRKDNRWCVHKRYNDKQRSKVLGFSFNLTNDKLKAIAIAINSDDENWENYKRENSRTALANQKRKLREDIKQLKKRLKSLEKENSDLRKEKRKLSKENSKLQYQIDLFESNETDENITSATYYILKNGEQIEVSQQEYELY